MSAIPDFDALAGLVIDLTWMSGGLCTQIGGDEWFPEKGGSSVTARKVCDACPIEAACLEYALDNGIREGVWGGVSARGRLRILETRASTRECAGDGCTTVIPRVGNKLYCGPCAYAQHLARKRIHHARKRAHHGRAA